MRGLRCTIDSSCVIALDHVGLVPSLSMLFSHVLVPQAVRKELFKRRQTKDRLRAIFSTYAFLERCDGYDQAAVDILLLERHVAGARDRGEVETIVQASQFGAMVLIDDAWGRDLAGRYDLECHGTLWVMEQLFVMQLLSGAQLRDALESLLARRIRLPRRTVGELLKRAGQSPILDA